MQYQKIFFLIILISISVVLISNQLQSTDNISILVNNSGPFIGPVYLIRMDMMVVE